MLSSWKHRRRNLFTFLGFSNLHDHSPFLSTPYSQFSWSPPIISSISVNVIICYSLRSPTLRYVILSLLSHSRIHCPCLGHSHYRHYTLIKSFPFSDSDSLVLSSSTFHSPTNLSNRIRPTVSDTNLWVSKRKHPSATFLSPLIRYAVLASPTNAKLISHILNTQYVLLEEIATQLLWLNSN